jgi:creatinine amidohydrolase/Fe(II)-dependent formamide hydrolase-like protein
MEKSNWVDGRSTSLEWETLARPLAILPVGSFEQHGPHLPLTTDTIMAEYFAAFLARTLGGALLPAIPILQCNEHSGFRGSVGLRPETAIALFRDLADAMERQNFKRLLIMNGHGGNFVLGPVVRDINRQDRALKILLMNWYDWDQSPEGQSFKNGLHAEGWETSVALAICPELVRDFSKLEPEAVAWRAQPQDLNHFGIGVLRPCGYWGDPRPASVEKGRAIVRSVEENLPRAARERLAWLDAQPEYAGGGRIMVRPLERWDLADGLRLAEAAGWNQRLEDWQMIQALSPGGNFVATRNGGVAGTVVTVNYANRVSWVAMVLVDPALRRRGVATQLMTTALENLAGCETVKLDATPAGRPVYEKLGFKAEYELSRLFAGSVPALPPAGNRVRPMTEADLAAVSEMDAGAFGVPRRELMGRLRGLAPEYAFVAEGDQGLEGFCLGRHGKQAEYLGPVTAVNEATARALAAAVLRMLRGRAVIVDVTPGQAAWQGWLKSLGFAEQRVLARMYKGSNANPGRLESVFAIAGPEFG